MIQRVPGKEGVQVTRTSTGYLAWVGLLLLCACGPNVVVNYDKSTNFSQYRTYRWGQGVPAKNPDVDQQIVESIDEQMARKGFSKTNIDPDLMVTYHAATREEVDYNDMYGAGGGPAYGSLQTASAGDVPMRVKVGEIVVDMYDTKQKRNVWHAVGRGLVKDDPSKTSAQIRKGAVKMFEKFPPTTK